MHIGPMQLRTAFVILALALSSTPISAEVPATGESARVDALFTHFDTGKQPGAAVMVIREGEIVHSRGYGLANLETGEKISADSTFRLGSVSKQFTAMAIALLAQRGQLDVDDPVIKYVPDLAPYPGISLRHILVHTSGLPDYYDEIDLTAWEERGTIPSNADVIAYVGQMRRPLFGPGENYEYSNPAYEVLPLVVEAVSGSSFAEFMHRELFVPLGMDNSLIHDHTRPAIPRQVTGYAPDSEGYIEDDWDTLNGITGSGSQFSTLEDFHAWDQALYGNEVLSQALLAKVFTRGRLNNSEEFDYGLGWRLDSYRGQRRIAHGGAWVGFNTAISRYPDLRFTIVILSNRAEYDPVAVSDQVADIYFDSLDPAP